MPAAKKKTKKTTKKTTAKKATKKAPAKKSRKTRKDANPDNLVMKLTGKMRTDYVAAYHRADAARSRAQLTLANLQLLSKDQEYAPVFKAIRERENAFKEFGEAKHEAGLIAKKICEKFNIPPEHWADYIIDTETGRMRHEPQGKKEEK